eukprot:COSAG03_NODE_9190_length_739_cov_1.560938_1_plen_110_part_00
MWRLNAALSAVESVDQSLKVLPVEVLLVLGILDIVLAGQVCFPVVLPLGLIILDRQTDRQTDTDSNLGWLQNVVEHATKHEYYLALARVSGLDQALRDVYFHATSSQKV